MRQLDNAKAEEAYEEFIQRFSDACDLKNSKAEEHGPERAAGRLRALLDHAAAQFQAVATNDESTALTQRLVAAMGEAMNRVIEEWGERN